METSCELLKIQQEISCLQANRQQIEQRIKDKKEQYEDIAERNLRYLKIIQWTKGAGHYSPNKCGVYPPTPKKNTTSTCTVGEKTLSEKGNHDNSTVVGATTFVATTISAVSPSSPSEMSAKTSVSLPISSGNGTNEVTGISKNYKKDNHLESVIDGEELSDAELILADTDLLCTEQGFNCQENVTKEGFDHSNVSTGTKAQESSDDDENECGKESTQDVQAKQDIEGNEEDEKCKNVPQKKNRRTKRSQAKVGFEGDNTQEKSNTCAKRAILQD